MHYQERSYSNLCSISIEVPLFWGVYFPLYEETKHYARYHYPAISPALIHCGSGKFPGAKCVYSPYSYVITLPF